MASHAKRSIAEHIRDYRSHLERKNTKRHAAQQIMRIERILEAGNIETWAGVSADSVGKVFISLTSRNSSDDDQALSGSTRNAYLTAMVGFCNWMAKQGRADRNPCKALSRVSTERKEHRRSLTPDEAIHLLLATMAGPVMVWRTKGGDVHLRRHGKDSPTGVRCMMTGEDRAVLYRFAMETGQRLSAIHRLTVQDLDLLDPSQATVLIRAEANTKSRQTLLIPLTNETARLLAKRCNGREGGSKVFELPKKDETAKMFRADLARARQVWLAEAKTPEDLERRERSDFLVDVDREGRRVDFHALRTTCASWLHNAGVPDSVAQRVTGHTRTATLKIHYQRASLEQTRQALTRMPSLPSRHQQTPEPVSLEGAPEKHHQKHHHSEHISVQSDATPRGEVGDQADGGELKKALQSKAKRDGVQLDATQSRNSVRATS